MRSLLAAAVLSVATASAIADEVRLRTGGTVRGEIESTEPDGLAIQGVRGTRFVLAPESVTGRTRRRKLIERYVTRQIEADRAGEVRLHEELAEWCREHRLTSRIDEQMESILRLDPDHEIARATLRHKWRENRWWSPDELAAASGLVRHRGRWITPAMQQLLLASESQEERSRDWFRQVKQWQTTLRQRSDTERVETFATLAKVDDPAAVDPIGRLLLSERDPDVRRHAARAIGRIGGAAAARKLAEVVVEDIDPDVRTQAIDALQPEDFPAAGVRLVRYLTSKNNAQVRQSAAAIAIVGSDDAIPHLVRALTTRHYETRLVADGAQSFSVGGGNVGFGSPGVLDAVELAARAGGPQPIVRRRPATRSQRVAIDYRNAEVRFALRQLTGEDFGYDKRRWYAWLRTANRG